MPRTKGGPKTRARRKATIKRAKGYWGTRRKLYAVARETVDRALAYAFAGRKQAKRQYRRLWVTRINAAVRPTPQPARQKSLRGQWLVLLRLRLNLWLFVFASG